MPVWFDSPIGNATSFCSPKILQGWYTYFMQTVLMAIAVIRKDDQILIRKFDPAKNPYKEPWGLFGGRLEGDGSVVELLNRELQARWNLTVTITDQLACD